MIKKEFKEIKEKVINLIKDKKEVTSKTNYKHGGIYMLYIDNFTDEKIIPFYIGETHDFQERHKEHMKEIFALNRLNKEYYIAAVINKYFDGSYKSCKLYKYLVDNNCQLKDIHMVLLEDCEDEEERKDIEQKYINEYLAPFLGFNQMNSITLSLEKKKGYFEKIKDDINQVKKYANYGFNRLNFILAKGIFENYEPKAYKELKEIKIFNDIVNLLQEEKIKSKEKDDMWLYAKIHSHTECERLCIDLINSFFEENGLKSEDKKKKVIDGLIYNLDKDKNDVLRYIEKFSKGSKEDIFALILNSEKGRKVREISEKIVKYIKQLPKHDEEIYAMRVKIFNDIIPEREYTSFPLKDLFKEKCLEIKQVGEDNSLYINIEFSNHGRRCRQDDYPVPIKIDYAFYKGFQKEKKTYYIQNEFTNFFENEDYYIIERNMYAFGKRQDSFKLGKRGGKIVDYSTISTSMEYYNGINEYTLREKETHKFVDVIKEIEKLIDKETKIFYTSGCKNVIKRWEESTLAEESLLMKKLIKSIKY